MNKIGIIGAMELEVETLKAHLTDLTITTKANMEFNEGKLGNVPVVVVRSGIGKVNAALCVQILVDHFSVTHIINTGVAGSLKAELDIGDIVISTDALYHDVDVQIFGYQLGEVPQLGTREFLADAELIEKAKASCQRVNPDVTVTTGRIVSGDQFISSKEVKERIIKNFDGYCTEMEGAAIAQASYLNHLPFVIIRAISDKADDSAEMDYPTFERQAAEHCAKLVEDLVTSF